MAICVKEQSFFDKNVYLIPGEKIIHFSLFNSYCLTLTNYRLYLICQSDGVDQLSNKCYHIGIPTHLILKVEQVDFKHLSLWTKIGSVYKLSFDNNENCSNWLKLISEGLQSKSPSKLFAFKYFKCLEKSKSEKWLIKSNSNNKHKSKLSDFYLIKNEFKRLNFSVELWKITDVNVKFQVCNSYPRYHIVPISITDDDIRAMAEFRGNKRFPSVVWRSKKNASVIIRCAQPQVGLMFWRNASDETFFKEVLKCLKSDNNTNRLLIIDARHYSTAQLNRIRGGGVEYSEYYGAAEIIFMQLENIHNVRSSFDCISIFNMNGENWLTSIENSYWLKYLGKLLKSSCDIAKALDEDGRSVIIHCSDGWDRTPQLTSLSQILLDDFYRTVKGFKILIEKEWIHFGHKFSDRCGFYKSIDNKEWSPIFVQWLDCIYQLIRQYPHYFEFNETFLIKLALHVYSGLFGNFLFNTDEERQSHNVSDSTASIWNFLSESNEDIINPLYYKFSSKEVDFEKYQKVIYPKYNTKFLFPWNRLFFEALNPSDIFKIFSLDYSSKSMNNFLNNENVKFHEDSITKNALSNQPCPLRKSKSETDISFKCKTILESSSKTKQDFTSVTDSSHDSDMIKCNGRFINQFSSTSTLNDININGFVNENTIPQCSTDNDQRLKKSKFQQIELIAYNHCDTSTNNVNGEIQSNLTENNFDQPVNNKSNQQDNQYFRLTNLDDCKEIEVNKNEAPCDLDGLYKSIEPINVLAKHWKEKFEGQQLLINQLKEKLLLKAEILNKIRYDSTSSVERARNEDSLSSYESYIMLDSPEHNHVENSKLENNHNVSPIQNSIIKSGNIMGCQDSYNFNKSIFPSYIRKSSCNQQSYYPCETGNSTEKAQA